MKKLTSLLLALTAASLFAQGITPIPNGPTVTTPSPAPAGTSLELGAQAILESHHYVVNLTSINALTGTSGSVALFKFPVTRYAGVNVPAGGYAALWVIDSIVIRPTTPVSGGGITDVTAQVRTGVNYGAAQHVFTGGVTSIPYVISTTGNTEAGGATVNLFLVSAGGNLSAATAGSIDVYIAWHVL